MQSECRSHDASRAVVTTRILDTSPQCHPAVLLTPRCVKSYAPRPPGCAFDRGVATSRSVAAGGLPLRSPSQPACRRLSWRRPAAVFGKVRSYCSRRARPEKGVRRHSGPSCSPNNVMNAGGASKRSFTARTTAGLSRDLRTCRPRSNAGPTRRRPRPRAPLGRSSGSRRLRNTGS